jgi:phosphatidylcholine synthase
MRADELRAWSVHGLTALGPVLGFLALQEIRERDWRAALLWLGAALVIDSFDGSLARRFRIREVLPDFDGKMVDWVSDFLNFVFIPAVLLFEAGLVPEDLRFACVLLVLFSAAFHFGNRKAVTEDSHFRGFPAFWNLVVYYLLILRLPLVWNAALVLLFFVLHFVPVKFVYPTRTGRFRFQVVGLTVLWLIDTLMVVAAFPAVPPWLVWLSLLFLGWMAALGFASTLRRTPEHS